MALQSQFSSPIKTAFFSLNIAIFQILYFLNCLTALDVNALLISDDK